MFAKNELSTAVTTPLLAIIVAVGAMFWAPPAQLLLWLATVFLAKGLLISLCRQFLKDAARGGKPAMLAHQDHGRRVPLWRLLGGGRLCQRRQRRRGRAHLRLRRASHRHLDAHAVRGDR